MITTYSKLRRNLATILDRVVNDREVIIVHHRRLGTVAILPADELSGLIKTARLLRAPKSPRPLKALERTREKHP